MSETRHTKSGRAHYGEDGAYPAERARQGTIILKRRWQRATFIAGLTVAVVIAFLAATGVIG
jgi:uncharacterized membrane protein